MTDWRALSAAEREREYSPSSCIGGHYQPFIAAYATHSSAAVLSTRALGASWSEHHYSAAPAQRLDVCLPVAAAAQPAKPALLVFIHGGYWQELSAQHSLFAAAGCIQHGHAFAAIDYTLAPQARLAEIVAECRAAVAWLLQHAQALGFDARRVVIAGSSAGAHLAAMVAAQQALRAAVLVSGIYELEPLLGTSINAALGLDAASARAQSPALLPLRQFPHTLMCWGEIETAEFKRQSLGFAGQLQAAGIGCQSLEVPARNHFDVILGLSDATTDLGRRTLALLAAA